MKIKHVLASLGLAMTTAFALAVGVGAKKEAKSVKADELNTWMLRFQLCLASCSPHSPSSVFPEDNAVDGVQFHYWGNDGLDEKVNAEYMFYFTHDYYGVNVALKDGQRINGAQWILHQQQSGDKYSVNIEKFGDESTTYLDKETSESIFVIQYQFSNSWEGDHWKFTDDNGGASSHINAEIGINPNITKYGFEKDPASNSFICSNVTIDQQECMSFESDNVDVESDAYSMLDDESLNYVASSQPNWWYINEGTFDFILTSSNYEIRKYVDPFNTYIYYVLEDNVPTNDYIYTWGGSEQFGSWPGKQIRTEIASASEVTGNGVLHFEGSETPKLIYKIPVTIGYPNGDSYFKFNNNDDWESEARPLVSGAAYWYAGGANEDAGLAIEFLVQAEYCRNTATDYSVCNISVNEAKVLVNNYNGLSAGVRDYIDRSSVWTYKRDGSKDNELVSYRLVVEELARIAGVELEGSSRIHANFELDANSATVAVVIIVAAVSSAVMLSLLFILKKKRK